MERWPTTQGDSCPSPLARLVSSLSRQTNLSINHPRKVGWRTVCLVRLFLLSSMLTIRLLLALSPTYLHRLLGLIACKLNCDFSEAMQIWWSICSLHLLAPTHTHTLPHPHTHHTVSFCLAFLDKTLKPHTDNSDVSLSDQLNNTNHSYCLNHIYPYSLLHPGDC